MILKELNEDCCYEWQTLYPIITLQHSRIETEDEAQLMQNTQGLKDITVKKTSKNKTIISKKAKIKPQVDKKINCVRYFQIVTKQKVAQVN